MTGKNDPRGSAWRRWDPHIHAPGTVMNDQFGGPDPWGEFVQRIDRAVPRIQALGITDYYSLDTYETVVQVKRQGKLPGVDLLFPNVEMRYGVGTGKGVPVNVHLLISPDDPNHIDEARRFLREFSFVAFGETFRCERGDLVRLGRRAAGNSDLDESAALTLGANQFKVSPQQLSDAFKNSAWARDHVLVAVSGGSNDGTSGLGADASFMSMRKEIERRADIVFASHPKQRDFWLGRGVASPQQLLADWGGIKPCLHGSDAHNHEKVGKPDLDRFCWIKGDATFETLRQACIEPEARVFIGSEPPRGSLPSQTIGSVIVTGTEWMRPARVDLNAGLVGIIGARGSGKTALADMIAAGGQALTPHLTDRSFIHRARDHLSSAEVSLEWESGDKTSASLVDIEFDEFDADTRVQYLSQQFVDRLCSAEGLTDELLAEIERVIYQAHPSEERLGTTHFRELLELRTARGRALRRRHEIALKETSAEIDKLRANWNRLSRLKAARALKAKALEKDKRDRQGLMGKGTDDRATELERTSAAAESKRFIVEQMRRRRQALLALKDEVEDTRQNEVPRRLRQLQSAHAEAALEPGQWRAFEMAFSGDVDAILAAALRQIDDALAAVVGPPPPVSAPDAPVSSVSMLAAGLKFEDQTLNALDAEVERLRGLVGVDREKQRAFDRLSEKISREEAALANLDRDIAACIAAPARIKELVQLRRQGYAGVFEGIVAEEAALTSLYEPLRVRLETEPGALGKLGFSIRRSVDLASWAVRGEALLDLRKSGAFKGSGTLYDAAHFMLKTAWEKGSSVEIAEAMAKFRNTYESDFIGHAQVPRDHPDEFNDWLARFSAWLYGTDHIKTAYGVQYESVEIERLSPGTRGIVLLLLYLAIDSEDDRPLIIDQPEENLDPKSIFDELVERFRSAKKRRQIVIVTHNANLIVNADADQVIVATCGPHRPGELPEISYSSGGLENPVIRQHVCEILEGGEAAFVERARRLRVRIR